MNIQQAKDQLKLFSVRYIMQDGNKFVVCIGDCGRNFDKERKFIGVDLAKLVVKVEKTFN